nr:MAG TPA: hypothetical protein [Caudoviricetes sp.]
MLVPDSLTKFLRPWVCYISGYTHIAVLFHFYR